MSCSEHHLCINASHFDDIDKLYHKLNDMIHLASPHLPHGHELRNRNVPGWNEHCRELYSKARQTFFVWHHSGRVRSGAVFDEIKLAHSNVKNSLQLKLRKAKLLSKFHSGNKSNF